MKEGIHPNYVDCTVSCACGYTFATRSTKPSIKLEICSNCHPFFTGKQKLMDSTGTVERFQKRFLKTEGKTIRKKTVKKETTVSKKPKGKILSTSPKRKKPVAAAKKETVKKEQ